MTSCMMQRLYFVMLCCSILKSQLRGTCSSQQSIEFFPNFVKISNYICIYLSACNFAVMSGLEIFFGPTRPVGQVV